MVHICTKTLSSLLTTRSRHSHVKKEQVYCKNPAAITAEPWELFQRLLNGGWEAGHAQTSNDTTVKFGTQIVIGRILDIRDITD